MNKQVKEGCALWRVAVRAGFFTRCCFAVIFNRRVRYELERSLVGFREMPAEHRRWLSGAHDIERDLERRVTMLGDSCLTRGERLWRRCYGLEVRRG